VCARVCVCVCVHAHVRSEGQRGSLGYLSSPVLIAAI
jgi:hypothetical protein